MPGALEKLYGLSSIVQTKITRWKRTNTIRDRDSRREFEAETFPESTTLLPVELILNILGFLAAPMLPNIPPSRGDVIVFPDLCSAARTCRLWARCAQPILFKHIILNEPRQWERLNQSIDPGTVRGGHLGEMILGLDISYWGEFARSSPPPGILSIRRSRPPPPNALEQLIQRCPRLKSLEIRDILYYIHSPRLSFSRSFSPPSTVRHLTISLTEWTCCVPDRASYAIPLVFQLITSAPWVKALHLDLQYAENRSPPLPSWDSLPPAYHLYVFKAYQYDALSRWVLQNSWETLRELELENASHLAEIAKTCPNVTTLKFVFIEEGESVLAFTKLETLHWISTNPRTGHSFVRRLPPSLQHIKFRSRSMIPVFAEIVHGGTLPNFQSVKLEEVLSWDREGAVVTEIDLTNRGKTGGQYGSTHGGALANE